jgi:hypothetical protein
MDLSTLPLLILQALIECLDPQSLVAISYTCRTLNIEANRRLYRSPYYFARHGRQQSQARRRPSTLGQSLHPGHSAIRFLRIYGVDNLQSLSDLWSTTPLCLKSLSFSPRCYESGNINECLDSMLPGTSVAQVVVHFPYDRGFEGMLRLLGVLHRLDSLVSLRITGLRPDRRDYPNVDNVIDAINCPQLKRLYLSNSDSSILPCLKDKLPSLEVLWVKDEPWIESKA